MLDFADTQNHFAAALLDPTLPVPDSIRASNADSAQRRFGVYRNNVIAGLIAALAERFPVVCRLVGEEFFGAMARVYVHHEPPRSPVLLQYGGSFPEFIESFEPVGSIEYLADVARLEFARGTAYHAADRRSMDAAAFAALAPAELGNLTATLHPSASLISSRFPIVSIWAAHQTEPVQSVSDWSGEAALIARPFLEVEVWRLPAGGHAFLHALAAGSTVRAALDQAAALIPESDLAAALAVLIGSNIVVELTRV